MEKYRHTAESHSGANRQTPERQFEAFIQRRSFPCVGAKSALNGGGLRVETGGDLTDPSGDADILKSLYAFLEAAPEMSGLKSFAVIFPDTPALTEVRFEAAFWRRLQALHDLDHANGFRYDPAVSADPESSKFALSFGGAAFFAVGLHPAASRASRRFLYPTVVLNLHSQFEALRHKNKYETMRKTILQRDENFCGSTNPMLHRHGEGSAATQYSGRQVDASWRCPFHPRRSDR